MNGTSLPHHDVAIAGSGFSGLGMAIRLAQEGLDDFVVLERADAVGGTWRDNHYPGCACDVPTPLYSFSFAPNPDWDYLYARYHELRAYMEELTDRYGIRDRVQLHSEVTGADWDEDGQRWVISIDGEPALTAGFVVAGFGGLSRPGMPKIAGLESFEGPLFHSAQWDHSVPLEGKRVAVIGTGASAIQLVPEVAKVAGHIDVFQRTAPWVMPKIDHKFSRVEKFIFRRVPIVQKALRGIIFGITESLGYPITRNPDRLAPLERAGRAHLRRQVPDEVLREKLKPDFRLGCKRILISNDWYPALMRDNVDVITDGIAQVTPTGVVTADGVEHAADVIVCASGFEIEEAFKDTGLRGRNGLALEDAWEEGIEAHRGTTVSGFPNLAILSGPNTGTGSTSQVYMIEAGIHYALELMSMMRAKRAGVADVRIEAQREYNDWLQERMQETVWLKGGCNSWYLDSNGINRTLYPGLSSQFARSLRKVNADEYEFTPARVGEPASPREPEPVA